MDRLEHALARIRRAPDAIAVLFLDLDNFKPINDNFGHQTGDQLLISVARRLETCVRPGDTVARLAGDEFTLLLENIVDIEDAFVVADRVLESLRSPVTIDQHELLVAPASASPTARPAVKVPTTCCTTPTWPCTARSMAARPPAGCSTQA